MQEPKWDGFRLLVVVDGQAHIRAWSRRGAGLGDRLGRLLEPLEEAPPGSVFDCELVALSSVDGHAVQDFAAVQRAVLQADGSAVSHLHLVAFDLLELAGQDIRSLPLIQRMPSCEKRSP